MNSNQSNRENANQPERRTSTDVPNGINIDIDTTPITQRTIKVNIGRPGKTDTVDVPLNGDTCTVGDALRAAKLNPVGYEIRMGGRQVSANDQVVEGAFILLLQPVVGNIR